MSVRQRGGAEGTAPATQARPVQRTTGATSRRPLRVAIVTETFLPTVNGVTNSVCQIADYLRAQGHEALIVAPGNGPAEYAGFPVERVASMPLPVYRSIPVGLPAARRMRHLLSEFQPDVVHLADPVMLGRSAIAAAQRLNLPMVAVFHTDFAGFAGRYRLRADRMIWRWLRGVHTRVHRTLAPSTATLSQLEQHGFPRLAYWPGGIDVETFHPRHRSPRLRAELAPDGEVLVGYIGRLAADKRVRLLTELADIPGIKIVVVGEGPEESYLRRAVPNAEFLGLRRGTDLSEAFASLDLFVHTGADETFCLAVQEALASGVPVIAPAAGGPLDLVQHGQSGLLYAPDDIAGLRANVRHLAESDELRTQLARHARNSVTGRTWSIVLDELVAHYYSVANINLVRQSRPFRLPYGLDRSA